MGSRQTSRPVIGINVEYQSIGKGQQAVSFCLSGYHDSVFASGALPVILPPMLDPGVISETLSLLDGVVMVGGSDLDPRNDGFMLHPNVRPMNPRRENSDRALMNAIAKRRLPVFGIGVGMQLLNVSQGGTLFLDIREDIPGALPHRDFGGDLHRHGLIVEKGTILDSVYGENDIRVSSCHHMSLDDIAPNFIVSARCPGDNVVEAIESTREDWFALGVQFHPESHAATVLDRQIFQKFVEGVCEFRETGRNPYAWKPAQPESKTSKMAKAPFSSLDSSEITFA